MNEGERVRFEIEFNPDALDHLEALPARARAIILDAIEAQLAREPLRETRNRKLLRPNLLAPWELRVAKWRVFYDVQTEPSPVVNIVAVGEKRGNEIWIGGERIVL